MRVQVVYNFYFEYRLPLIEPGVGFSLKVDVPNKGYVAHVRGRRDEDDLFYEDIGTSLSQQTLNLSPVGGQGTLVYRVNERVLDRLLVALELTADEQLLSDHEAVIYWRDEAVFIANSVLDHLRVAARSPRVKGIERLWHPVEQSITISHPHTQSWFDLDTDARLPMFEGTNSSLSVGLVSPNGGSITLQAFSDSLASGQQPSLSAGLLVDAEEYLRELDYRKAIPLAAMACETGTNQYSERQTKLSNSQVKNILKMANHTFAQRRLEQLPMAICGKSLLHDDPEAFQAVDALYAERNKIMHRGVVSDTFAAIDRYGQAARVHEWLSAAERTLTWLEQLPTA